MRYEVRGKTEEMFFGRTVAVEGIFFVDLQGLGEGGRVPRLFLDSEGLQEAGRGRLAGGISHFESVH